MQVFPLPARPHHHAMADELWRAMEGPNPATVLSHPPRHLHQEPSRGTPDYGRSAWNWSKQLSNWTRGCGVFQQHDRCWGWDIVRVSYLDDVKFAHAVRAVAQLAELYITCEYEEHVEAVKAARQRGREKYGPVTGDFPVIKREPNDMARRHYHHGIWQDQDGGLDGATTDEARGYLLSHGWNELSGTRSRCFIYMDEQTIDHLSSVALPGEEEWPTTLGQKQKTAVMHWVKAVDVYTSPTEQRQHRLRLYDLFEVFLLAHGGLHRFPTWKSAEEGDDDVDEVTAKEWPFVHNQYSGLEPKWVRNN